MKRIKAMAVVLTVAMLAVVFAGCANTTTISTDKFQKACEKLKLEEFDFEDDSPELDDVEDGFFAVADEDMVEEKEKDLEDMLKSFKLDGIIDTDDVESFAFAAKATGLDDIKDAMKDPEDIADLEVDGAVAFVMTLSNDGYAEDVMDAIEELLDDADIDVKDLSKQEYMASKKEGYFRCHIDIAKCHIDIAKFAKIILDNDDIMDLIETAADKMDIDAEELLESLSGDVAFTIEVNGKNIFFLAGGSLNTKPTVLNSFASSFGAAMNPVKVPMNTKLIEEKLDDSLDTYLSKLKNASSQHGFLIG